MKCLSLYVDSCCIVGVICTDNDMQRVVFNGEDRAWLYFYEDTVNDRVLYGKKYKSGAHKGEPHYYQNVFAGIDDPRVTFRLQGKDWRISKIFEFSNIFDDLKTACDGAVSGDDSSIPTYISFSQDIGPDAQEIFIKQLGGKGFLIKSAAGKIGLLAVEWLRWRDRMHLAADKKVLVLNSACDDLYVSVYSMVGKRFVESADAVLNKTGGDVRRKVVIEAIIRQGDSNFKLLTKEEEFNHERKLMEIFVDDWISLLDAGRPGFPVKIADISFSTVPACKFCAVLKSDAIDKATRIEIKSIVEGLNQCIKKNDITETDFGAVVMIGNPFKNKQYSLEIDSWLQIEEKNMFTITEDDYPEILRYYSQIFKEEQDSPEMPMLPSDIRFSETKKVFNLNEPVTDLPVLTKSNTGIVTYTSSDISVAKVDARSGAVTLLGEGQTVITATVGADTNYSAGSASYILTVNVPKRLLPSDIRFSETKKVFNLNEPVTDLPVLTKSNTGAVTYISSDISVAKVDARSGAVTLLGEGQTVITATVGADTNYSAGSASYSITVKTPGTVTPPPPPVPWKYILPGILGAVGILMGMMMKYIFG